MNMKKELEENKKLIKKFNDEYPQRSYKTKCAICGREITTIKKTANEGICYECRCI